MVWGSATIPSHLYPFAFVAQEPGIGVSNELQAEGALATATLVVEFEQFHQKL